MSGDAAEVHVSNNTFSRSPALMSILTSVTGKTRDAFGGVLKRTKRLVNRSERPTNETDAERVSTASTAIEDAMAFCAADEAACGRFSSSGMSASEYHKVLARRLGASLSTDTQVVLPTTIRSPRQQDPHIQNGLSGATSQIMNGSRVEASELANRPPKNKAEMIQVSKNQIIAAVFLCLAAIVVAILVTYTITKESMSKSDFLNSSFGGSGSNYNDQFDRPQQPRPYEVSDLQPEEQNETSLEGEPTAKELRLSTDLFPIFYNLTVKVYLPGFVPLPEEKNMTFDGALIIKFKVLNPTNKIELNSLNLHYTNKLELFSVLKNGQPYQLKQQSTKRSKRATASNSTDDQALIVSTNGTRPVSNADVSLEIDPGTSTRVNSGIRVTGISLNETLQKVVFQLDGQLQKDQTYYFNLPYSGLIDQKLSGLYLTTYTDPNGQQRYAAVTQMEPIDARKFAPCFDEPAMKSVWRLRVIHPVGTKAASNSIEQRQDEPTNDPNWVLTTFEETLPMSSYLLALFISDFQYNEGRTKSNIRFRIWSRQEALNHTEYALQAGIKCLEFYEDYYGIPFPLAKQDMVALPDFGSGAMENWGLITYREKYLLYSPQLYSVRQKVHAATVVAHELAHQWFGNLVTMEWWDALWLNEGFATLMEFIGAKAISDNKFRTEEAFVIDAMSNAFNRDARATSHPLIFNIDKAEDVVEAFDSITYDKGASVLRMIQQIMGEDNFKKGLTIYLNRFKFKNAQPKDLWDALNEVIPSNLTDWSGEKFDVNEFAKYWTKQMGYPVIEVKRLDESHVELSQQRFKLDEETTENSKFNVSSLSNITQQYKAFKAAFGLYWYKWDVPIWSSVNGTENQMLWLHDKAVINVGEYDTLIVNTDSRGFYRVMYSKKTLENINKLLLTNHESISTRTRARIIDDAFTSAQAGKLSYEAALNLTFYLNKETEYLPWYSALDGLDTVQYYFGDEPELGDLREYTTSLVSNLYEKISWDSLNSTNDDVRLFENMLEVTIIGKMCANRNTDCTDKLSNIYYNNFVYPCQNGQKKSSQCSSVPISIRAFVYCEGIKTGSEKDWERMLEMYKRETVQVERERLLVALTCSHDAYTLKRLLSMTIDLNNTLIRYQDKPSVFESISGQEPMGQFIALEFFLDHWDQIYRDFKDEQTLLRSIVAGSIGGTSARTVEQVEQFLKKNQKRTKNLDIFKQRLEILRTNRKWIDTNLKTLSQWFKDQNQKRRQQKSG